MEVDCTRAQTMSAPLRIWTWPSVRDIALLIAAWWCEVKITSTVLGDTAGSGKAVLAFIEHAEIVRHGPATGTAQSTAVDCIPGIIGELTDLDRACHSSNTTSTKSWNETKIRIRVCWSCIGSSWGRKEIPTKFGSVIWFPSSYFLHASSFESILSVFTTTYIGCFTATTYGKYHNIMKTWTEKRFTKRTVSQLGRKRCESSSSDLAIGTFKRWETSSSS